MSEQSDGKKPTRSLRENPELAEILKKALKTVMSSEHPLLYDHAGRPIPSDSELWQSRSELMDQASAVVEELLSDLPIDALEGEPPQIEEKLADHLKTGSSPRYTFSPHDGKLTLPLSLRVGQVQIQVAIPLYKIFFAALAIAGIWRSKSRHIAPVAFTRRINPIDQLEHVWLPAGEYLMGAVPADRTAPSYEKPQHAVRITKGFWFSTTHVTVAAFKNFSLETGHPMPKSFRGNPDWGHADHPIANTGWYDAVAYCKWAGCRLPTEAEWEYAARGGKDNLIYPWGNEVSESFANFAYPFPSHNSRNRTTPVRHFPPTSWGLFDVVGNVSVWTNDWFEDDYYSKSSGEASVDDPQGPSDAKWIDSKVCRGGSYCSVGSNVRCSFRTYQTRSGTDGHGTLGFRVIWELADH